MLWLNLYPTSISKRGGVTGRENLSGVDDVELAEIIGFEVDTGTVVDEFLRTNHSDIYAAGDVAAFFNPARGKRIRVEQEYNANSMGELAGRNMASKSEAYDHLPFFYSLFELRYEAVGEVDSRVETFVDWTRPNEEAVISYLHEGRVRGVCCSGMCGGRWRIGEPGPFTTMNLTGRLPANNSSPKPDS